MFRTLLCGAAFAAALGIGMAAEGQGRPQIILFQEDNYRGNQLAIDRDTPVVGERVWVRVPC